MTIIHPETAEAIKSAVRLGLDSLRAEPPQRLERGTAKKAGRRYFVSLGRYRDATRHLAPGIWAASGPGGVDVRPVLMFVKTPNYKPRLSMQAVIDRSNLQDYLDRRVRYRVRNLAEGKLA